ncbi:MAG: alpha/beta hydrolase family protein [Bacteroidia bacterium]
MKLISEGFQFILNTSLFKNSEFDSETEINLPGGKTPILLFTPSKKEKGLIISFTGFSMSGYKDRRIAIVNNAFCKMGYRVITPKIDTIDALMIHPKAIDEVKELIQVVINDPILNPNKYLPAVFAPSFTAGITALAVAEMPANSVSSMCLLGGFCDFETTIQFALTNEENMDDYGMHVLMKNFLKYEIGENPEIENLVQTALEDNGLKRTIPLLPEQKAKSKPENVELYQKLVNETAFRKDVIMRAWTKIPDFSNWKNRLDLAIYAHKITCPVAIIHGKNDNVIPSSQSIQLHSIIKNNNKNVHLELSNLLDHGDLKISHKILVEITNLAKAFNFFTKHCAKLKDSGTKNESKA